MTTPTCVCPAEVMVASLEFSIQHRRADRTIKAYTTYQYAQMGTGIGVYLQKSSRQGHARSLRPSIHSMFWEDKSIRRYLPQPHHRHLKLKLSL